MEWTETEKHGPVKHSIYFLLRNKQTDFGIEKSDFFKKTQVDGFS